MNCLFLLLECALDSGLFPDDPLRPGGKLLPNVTEEDYDMFKQAQEKAQQAVAKVGIVHL